MIADLATGEVALSEPADVAIVGGGTAGLVLACRLAAKGKRVVVLESGGMRQDADTHTLNDVDQIGVPYAGAADGRFRCLGGTSTRWGGALIPFSPADTRWHPPSWDADWLGLQAGLDPYIREVENLFGLTNAPYEDAAVASLPIDGAPAFLPRSAKWPAFSHRNVAQLLEPQIESDDGPLVVLNATAVDFAFAPDGRLERITAQSPGDGQVVVRAKEFVLAAGAIESTRLLHLIDRAADDRLFAPRDVLGRYFADHLSAVMFSLRPVSRRALNRLAGFRFEGKGMRNLRFEASEGLRRAEDLPASLSHIGFETKPGGGFDLLRAVLRSIQRRERLPFGQYIDFVTDIGWLMRAVWWRAVHKRLLYPDDADINFHVVIEQRPDPESRIGLSSRRDRFGLPLALIDWRIGSSDQDSLSRTSSLLADAWRNSPYGSLAEAAPPKVEVDITDTGGIFHPCGSTRIGRGPADGVLDRDFRTFAVPNLSVVATSAFPTGGGANPTMTLLMAAMRAGDRLVGQTT